MLCKAFILLLSTQGQKEHFWHSLCVWLCLLVGSLEEEFFFSFSICLDLSQMFLQITVCFWFLLLCGFQLLLLDIDKHFQRCVCLSVLSPASSGRCCITSLAAGFGAAGDDFQPVCTGNNTISVPGFLLWSLGFLHECLKCGNILIFISIGCSKVKEPQWVTYSN